MGKAKQVHAVMRDRGADCETRARRRISKFAHENKNALAPNKWVGRKDRCMVLKRLAMSPVVNKIFLVLNGGSKARLLWFMGASGG